MMVYHNHPSMAVVRSVNPRVERHGTHGTLIWHPRSFLYKYLKYGTTLKKHPKIPKIPRGQEGLKIPRILE